MQYKNALRSAEGDLPGGDSLNDGSANRITLPSNDWLAALDAGEDGETAGWAHYHAGQPRQLRQAGG